MGVLQRVFPVAYPSGATVHAARSRSSASHLTPSAASPGGTRVGVGPSGARYGRSLNLEPFTFPTDWVGVWSREAAMSMPTISRARDLLCSLVGSLPLSLLAISYDATGATLERLLPPYPWLGRPDPDKTRNWLLAWTTDDLLFEGRAYWHVTARYANGFPRTFERMPAMEVGVDQDGRVRWRSAEVDPADVVEFLSPIESLLVVGARAMRTALELDLSAERYARLETPAGWLQEVAGGEPSDGTYLSQQASAFAAARHSNSIAALNNLFEYHESSLDPDKLQLTSGRQYQALELARVANVPPYLVGAPSGTGMTYQNALQARGDLVDFGAMPYVNCLEQTLSGPNVLPAGQVIRLDVNAWLRSPLTTGEPSPNDLEQSLNAPLPAPLPPPNPEDQVP